MKAKQQENKKNDQQKWIYHLNENCMKHTSI